MRQLIVLFKLILLTAALAAGTSTAEPLGLKNHSVSLVALSEAVTLRSDFENEADPDEPADLLGAELPTSNTDSKAYQLRTIRAQRTSAGLPPARGPPLSL